jgi:hypothetical protein
VASDRARLAANLFAVAEPDRETVALAASGRAEASPLGGGLGQSARTSQSVPLLGQFATGSHELLQYVGLLGQGKLAQALQVPP